MQRHFCHTAPIEDLSAADLPASRRLPNAAMSSDRLATTAPEAGGRSLSLRQWVKDHDESWVFVVMYIGLAVGLSVFVSLFWLVAVAALHFLLELARQAHYREGSRSVVLHALWEIKLDMGLVLIAVTLVLYIDVILGILGLQSAARAAAVSRAGMRVGSRAAAWERNLRAFLLTVDDMARIAYAAVMLRRKRSRVADLQGSAVAGADEGRDAPLQVAVAGAEDSGSAGKPGAGSPSAPQEPVWRERWGIADRVGIVLIALGALLLVAAPIVTAHDWTSARQAIIAELHPYPS